MAKIISLVGPHKGGVGKTTTAGSLGGILQAKYGAKVLLVDLDDQHNLTNAFLDSSACVRDVFEIFEASAKKDALGTLPIVNIREGLDIIPSSTKIQALDMTLGNKPGREFPLKKALVKVVNMYDYIIVDCPGKMGTAASNALTAADYVIIPMGCDAFSLGGLNDTVEFIDDIKDFFNPSIKIAGILMTKFYGRRCVDSAIDENVKERYGEMVFATKIRTCQALVDCPFFKKDIYTHNPSSNGAVDYLAFADELLKRIGC